MLFRSVVVVTAIGRELVGFLWAIARELAQPGTAAQEALKKKTAEALKRKKPGALEKETPAPVKPAAKAGRTAVVAEVQRDFRELFDNPSVT